MAGEVTALGHRPLQRAGRAPTREMVRAPARGGRRDHRQDQPPELAIIGATESPDVRRDAQPLGPRRAPPAGRAAAAPRRWRPGSWRRATATDGGRLDPHPGGQLRARRPEAAARPGPAHARRASTGTGMSVVGLRAPAAWPTAALLLDVGAAPTRRRSAAYAGRGGHRRPGRLRVALSTQAAAPGAGRPRRCGAAVEETARACCARSATRCEVRDPAYPLTIGQQLHRRATSAGSPRTWPGSAPGAAPAPHARLRAASAGSCRRAVARARQARRGRARPSGSTRSSRTSTCC